MSQKWTAAEIPDQGGRTALVTGGNSGLGLETAKALAAAGATVVIGCRDQSKAATAIAEIERSAPGATVEPVGLDLADLSSVARAADEIRARSAPLDLLINNAGVMAPPRLETVDGFELQLGTNHLGHFALTGLLLGKLLEAPAPRVVTLSSLFHSQGEMDFADLNWERSYSRWPAYGRSKLANLVFTFELDRRLRAKDSALIAAAAHPGYASTNLQTSGPGKGRIGALLAPALRLGNVLMAQSGEMGALPTLYAATKPDVVGSNYVGPGGPRQVRGHPVLVGCSDRARDEDDWKRLWDASIELTGVTYPELS